MKRRPFHLSFALLLTLALSSVLTAQDFDGLTELGGSVAYGCSSTPACGCSATSTAYDIMDTRNHRLIEYRRMFRCGTTPTQEELLGQWRGVNKGVVELVGYKQFIKEITPSCCGIAGDNIKVGQVSNDMLRCVGWQPKIDECTGLAERQGKFAVLSPRGRGAFKHGVEFNYRQGGNDKRDPAKLLVDKVVKIDDNHLLGRATANFGPLKIPLAYFVLERM